jgi:hypothetical protein
MQKKLFNATCSVNATINPALDQCDNGLTCTDSRCKKLEGASCVSNDDCQCNRCSSGKCKSLITAMDSVILSSTNQINLLNLTGRMDKIFRLAYRASRDGWRGFDFHDHCNGLYNTLTVVRSTTGFIFGGFLNARWDSRGTYNSDPYSFIYTLTNPSNSPAVMKMKNTDGANAIYTGDSYGKKF